ncbi:1-deoxy-D-xylulose-5-phosphate reductoisomerase [bacterium]|nr:1-deoxy-D-xylulose-5-phosphate reductoisomerase [bacterium]
MKKITILGSTGSIGTNTLRVVDSLPARFEIIGLCANSNVELLIGQCHRYKPKMVAIKDEKCLSILKKEISSDIKVVSSDEGIIDVATHPDNDLVVSAIVGSAGLYPTYRAIEQGIDIALANKEALVMAGDIIMAKAKEKNVNIIPVDSEHSAIFQCLASQKNKWVNRLLLTASGGPFLHTPKDDFSKVTVVQALAHPKWSMGKKISIDSATMMNKGLELIEAIKLFSVPADKISVIIHPESIIHSMVEYIDGSYIAQMNVTDMTIPIQYALTYPEREKGELFRKIDFFKLKQLNFFKPDFDKFICLRLAYEAAEVGHSMPAVLNAANEQAVKLFLQEKIKFVDIPYIIEKVMSTHQIEKHPSIDDLINIDNWARDTADNVVSGSATRR